MSQQIPIGAIPTFHARREPTRPAITCGSRIVTRNALEAAANRRARWLAEAGVRQGDFVSFILTNCVELFETTFAIWKLGAVPQPLSPGLPAIERDAIIDLVRPRAIVTHATENIGGQQTLSVDRPIDQMLSPDPLPDCVPPYWRATTSGGSTGRPKIIVSHGMTMIDPLAPFPFLGMSVDRAQLNPGPLYHGGPFSYAFLGLFFGAHLIESGKFEPLIVLKLLEKHKVDWIYLVPTMMNRIYRLTEDERQSINLSSLRRVFHMAAACPHWLKQGWIDWLGPERIWELYSGTESQGMTIINGHEWLQHRGSVGRVQPGSQLRIIGPNGRYCVPGEIGEIFFLPDMGSGSTYHYIGAEAKKVGEWESLGDLGYLDEDEYLYVVDRRTDMIVSGGVNVYPAEVEAALEAHPAVECAIVVGLPDDDLGHRVHAVVQLAEKASAVTERALRDFLVDRLIRHKIPKSIEFVEDALRNSAGKVRRSTIRDGQIALMSSADDGGTV